MIKKVLLVDTNLSSLPIYEYLVSSGFNTYVIGSNPNDFLAKYSLNYINSNYSDFENFCSVLEKYKFDYIVPGCNDIAYEICSLACKVFDFPGLDSFSVNNTLNNKLKFREFALENNISVPSIYNKISDKYEFPIIIKPVDAFSGKGITIINENNPELIKEGIKIAIDNSKNSEYIIEQYVSGQLFSHSAFISNCSIQYDFIVREDCTAYSYAVDTSRLIYDFPKDTISKIRKTIEHLANLLNLTDGLLHTQFILDKNDFWLIEPTRRCPGDLYSQLINYSTNFNYAENYARPFLNQPFSISNNLEKNYIIRHTITNKTTCNLRSLKFKFPLNLIDYYQLSTVGDEIKQAPYSRVGIFFMRANDLPECENLYNHLINRNFYNLY